MAAKIKTVATPKTMNQKRAMVEKLRSGKNNAVMGVAAKRAAKEVSTKIIETQPGVGVVQTGTWDMTRNGGKVVASGTIVEVDGEVEFRDNATGKAVAESADEAFGIDAATAIDGDAGTAKPSSPAEGEPPMMAGVLMRCTLHSSIGLCAAEENSRYAIESVLVLRDNPINPAATREPVGKKCVYVATNGRIIACSFGTLEEREASEYKQLWTRIPSEYCKLGSNTRTISLAASPDQGLFGLERAWCIDGRHRAPVAEGPFPPIVDVLGQVDPETHVVVGINIELLSALAKAVNSVMDEDDGKVVRLILPRDLSGWSKSAAGIHAVGSAGIGKLMPANIEDQAGYIESFNTQRIEVCRMFNALPDAVKHAPLIDQSGGLRPSTDRPEPWWPQYLATKVDELELTPALMEMLKRHSLNTVGDIQKVLDAAPQKGLCSLKGVGPGKAEKVGEATLKRWNELSKASKAATPETEVKVGTESVTEPEGS